MYNASSPLESSRRYHRDHKRRAFIRDERKVYRKKALKTKLQVWEDIKDKKRERI